MQNWDARKLTYTGKSPANLKKTTFPLTKGILMGHLIKERTIVSFPPDPLKPRTSFAVISPTTQWTTPSRNMYTRSFRFENNK